MPDESPSGKDGYASNFQQDSKVERIREVSLFGMLPRFQVLCLPLLKKFGAFEVSGIFNGDSPAEIHFLVAEGAGRPLTYFCVISTCFAPTPILIAAGREFDAASNVSVLQFAHDRAATGLR